MKAIVYEKYGQPDVLQLKEVVKPIPKDDEVLVRTHAASVTAVDCAFRKGDQFSPRLYTGLIRPKKRILGGDVAGSIEAVGKSVTRFREGDPVFGPTDGGFGAYAEYVCLPENGALAMKPVDMTYEEAASASYGVLTALPFLRDHAKIQSGQKILINGAAGSVGTAAIQFAKYFGAEVTGVCGAGNLELVRSLGADRVIDYAREDFAKADQAYDVIFDTVGKRSFSACKGSLTPKGVYLSTVLTLEILLRMLGTSVFGSRKAMIAFTGLRPSSAKIKDLIFLKELVEAGKIKSVIDRCYPLERAAEAHRYVEKGHKKGNVVISISQDGSL